jgi:SAM-dependent methyltransferase
MMAKTRTIGTPSLDKMSRLDRFYGDVSQRQNKTIVQLIPSGVERVLDVGCGLGNFTNTLRAEGYDAVGLDLDNEALVVSRKRYRANALVSGDVYCLPFGDEAFDYAVLRESAHHFDLDRVLSELRRVVRGGVIIFEPNPVWVVRLARKIIAHVDGEAPLEEVVALLRKHNFSVRSIGFSDVVAFPLSGGYVGFELVPNFVPLKKFVLASDTFFERITHVLRLERSLCWRYVLLAHKEYL